MGSVESIYLFQLARDRTDKGRKNLAKAISGVFLDKYPSLTQPERAIMFDILHQLVHEIEMSLRVVVSEHLAELPDVPRNLAKILANDAVEVAFPILTLSVALLDEDLIEVIRNRTIEHQLAITERTSISEAVSDAIVETGHENVIVSLLNNNNAQISSATLEYLAEESRRITAYQEPMLHREDLDPMLAVRMFEWVSTALRQYIVDNYEIEQSYIDEILEGAILDEVLSDEPAGKSPRAPGKIADELEKEGGVTPELMVDALRDGEVRLFVQMFHRITGLGETLVMEMLYELDGKGLAIACKAAGLDKEIFDSLFTLNRKARPKGQETLRQDLRKALNLYDKMSEDAATKVVDLWKGDVDYTAAIRELELS